MNSIIKWAIKNSPAMNTFLVAALILGAVSMVIMRREVFPNFQLEILLVTVPFPGATPDEVEEGICQKIESVVNNVEGVKKVTSVARESFGFVVLELTGDVTDVQPVLNEVRSQIDQISSFPPSIEDPEVKQIVFRAPAITVGVLGPKMDESVDPLEAELQLRELTEDIRRDLLDLRAVPPKNLARKAFSFMFQPKGAAVSGAEISGARPFEIAVEVPEDTLRKFGFSLDALANNIRRQNVEMPGGKMQTPSQEVLLRGSNKREVGAEIANIPILTRPNGDVITVGDIGTVIDGFEETTRRNKINERPGLAIRVTKTNSEDLFTIVEAVQKYISEKQVPPGYELTQWNDISVDVRDRIELLSRNGMQGLILVFLVLAIFLDLRLAFWVAVGIPVSILGAGFVLLAFGQTLNMLTMFAFLMALGIVVDDAIVIGENIYTKRTEGLNYVQASIQGTSEVLPSVCASVATTIIAFMPLMFVSGIMGKFISVMPIAVIAMLVISLVESMFILPSHLAHENNLFIRGLGLIFYIFRPLVWVIQRVNKFASGIMEMAILRFYRPLLVWSLKHKPIVLSASLAFGLICGGLIAGGLAPFGFFPDIDGREISSTIAFPDGTSADFSEGAAQDLKSAIEELEREHIAAGRKPFIDTLFYAVGEIGNEMAGGPTGVTSGSHVATVEVQLMPTGERDISSDDLIDLWREKVPKIAGTEVMKFGSAQMGPGGNAVEFKILADEDSVQFLEAAVEECKRKLAEIDGVNDIEDDSRLGKWEMSLKLNELGRTLGLSENSLANTLRSVYFGNEVMRLQRGRHEVKLMVRYPKEERMRIESFENIRIRDGNEREWPITEIADISYRRASSEVNRLDQRRSITITADVDKKIANPVEVNKQLKDTIVPNVIASFEKSDDAKLAINWEGEQADTQESTNSMFSGFGIALLCMYVLLTLQFRSYVQPLIILAIIPFGWLGAIVGHAILDIDLTLFSFFGLIALTGVIVNDSIVLVDFINRRTREGMPLKDSLVEAGVRRFRPIMLTSMTTVAGLFPMLLETSMQAQVLIPMAASLIFGLMTGTLLILILVPVFYDMYGWVLNFLGMSLTSAPYDIDESELQQQEAQLA